MMFGIVVVVVDMRQRGKVNTSVVVAFRVTPDLKKQMTALATVERRRLSNMTEVLVLEALNARKRREKRT